MQEEEKRVESGGWIHGNIYIAVKLGYLINKEHTFLPPERIACGGRQIHILIQSLLAQGVYVINIKMVRDENAGADRLSPLPFAH